MEVFYDSINICSTNTKGTLKTQTTSTTGMIFAMIFLVVMQKEAAAMFDLYTTQKQTRIRIGGKKKAMNCERYTYHLSRENSKLVGGMKMPMVEGRPAYDWSDFQRI